MSCTCLGGSSANGGLGKKYSQPRRFVRRTDTYCNTPFHYDMPSTWTSVEPDLKKCPIAFRMHHNVILQPVKKRTPCQFSFQVQNIGKHLGRALAFEEFRKISREGLQRARFPGFRIIEETQSMELNGHKFYEVDFEMRQSDGVVVRQIQILTTFDGGRAALLMTYKSAKSVFDKYLEVARHIFNSVTFGDMKHVPVGVEEGTATGGAVSTKQSEIGTKNGANVGIGAAAGVSEEEEASEQSSNAVNPGVYDTLVQRTPEQDLAEELCTTAYQLVASSSAGGFEDKQQLKDACSKFCQSVNIHPASPAYVGLAYLHVLIGDPEKALQYLDAAEQVDPTDDDIQAMRDSIYDSNPQLKP